MTPKKPMSTFFTIRVTPSVSKAFRSKIGRHNTPSNILREMINLVIEGKLVLTPPVTVTTKGNENA